jgi:hypothetical protein
LRLSAAPDLVHIPWEFLFDPLERRFIALSVDSPIVRFLDVPGATRPFVLEPPVRVLVVIASPTDYTPLDVEAEWARLKEAVSDIEARGEVALERLERPTLGELQRALRRTYHVLHFIGHGGFDSPSQDGLLVFEDDAGRGSEVSATYISTLLRDADSLRLAVLNACDGARASRTDQFAGVAQSLLLQGVPAVVAMQFEITDDAAITFAREFYGAFADGYSVEAAMVEARKSIFAVQNDSEWATPVLYLRSGEGPLFRLAPGAAPPVRTAPVDDPPVQQRPPIAGSPPPVSPEPGDGGDIGGGQPDRGATDGWWKRLSRPARTGIAAAAVAAVALGIAAAAWFALSGGGDDAEEGGGGDEYGTFAGTWFTNFSRVELEEQNGRVTGRYFPYLSDGSSHPLAGTVEGNNVSGTFQGDTYQFAFLRLNDKDLFEGYWIDQNGRSHEWCGTRATGVLPEGCGYSGVWYVKGLPPSLELSQETVYITQTADTAILRLESARYGTVDVVATFDGTTLARATGAITIARVAINWLVTEEARWDAFRGEWESTPRAAGDPHTWCAWREGVPPPC